MKYFLLMIVLVFAANYSKAEVQEFKVPLEEVFVVPEGYDTNDNVEITFLAKLPNACFKPHRYELLRKTEKQFHLNFFIKRKKLSACKKVNSK